MRPAPPAVPHLDRAPPAVGDTSAGVLTNASLSPPASLGSPSLFTIVVPGARLIGAVTPESRPEKGLARPCTAASSSGAHSSLPAGHGRADRARLQQDVSHPRRLRSMSAFVVALAIDGVTEPDVVQQH
ncbi:hypothetical protein VTO73DRAFT_4810 [Trametes versicolor]